MKIYSYNVNGIRAAVKKGLIDWMKDEKPDVLCIQETKAQQSQLMAPLFEALGYQLFSTSAVKKGYSGVLTLSKKSPDKVTIGMGVELFDNEGRVVRVDYGNVALINVYIPSGTTGDIRQELKMKFLDDFFVYLNAVKDEGKQIIVCGDFNICHKPIDINHPERHKKSSGFLPEEREWVDKLIQDGFVDCYREFFQDAQKYTWWSYRANSRQKNLGWRIDYHFITEEIREQLHAAAIHPEVFHSDHCPISIEIDI